MYKGWYKISLHGAKFLMKKPGTCHKQPWSGADYHLLPVLNKNVSGHKLNKIGECKML